MGGVYTRLVSSVVFPLHERLKGHDTVAVRKSLEETQWWPSERIAALRLERLRNLLAHAALHVPYYRNLFAKIGFAPTDLGSLADLAQLPFLTKAHIRSDMDLLKSETAKGLAPFNTGGSSGEPLVFYIGKERVSHDVAAKWRATRWWGVDIGDPEIVVWGSPIELDAQDRVRKIRDGALRTELLPAFEMSDANLDDFIARIRRRRPRMLFGYPSAISYIAAYAEGLGTVMSDLGIRVAFVTAEKLYDGQRDTIARVFGCRVANGYGGRDAGFVAHMCPEGGMHITAEDIIVEAVDQTDRPLPAGEAGELVVTHLATKDFPFIRYRTGDVGILDERPCSCGRGLPTLREVQGRATDFVVAQDGTVIHGLALIYVLRDLAGIKAFRICQESLDRTDVLIVPDRGFDHGLIETIQAGVKSRLGPGVTVNVELVPQIRSERSGKFRYVVSRVAA